MQDTTPPVLQWKGTPFEGRGGLALLAGGVAIGLAFFLRETAEVFVPFTVALLLALAAYPAVQWLAQRRVPPALSAAMVVGVQAARRRDLTSHAHAMRHVLGQMSVAVVSRLMIVALDALGMDPEFAYVAALWVPVLASIAVVEWLCRRPRPSSPNPVNLIERMTRETSPLAVVLRVRALAQPVARDGR